MIYFLFGEDKFRLLQEEKVQTKEALKKGYSFVEQNFLDATLVDFSIFWNLLSQKSFFSSDKIIILRNVLNDETFKKQLLKEIEKLASLKDLIILSHFGKVKPSDVLFKKLQKTEAIIEDFSLLTGAALDSWIKNEAASFNVTIDNSAFHFLKSLCAADLFCLSSEIKKLACFSNKIDKEVLEILSFRKQEINIFETIDSLAQKNKKKALALLQKHLNKGESPLYLLSMFAYQIRNLILVKQFFSLGAFKLGINPFVFRKLALLRDNFSFEELKKFFFALFEVDYKIKTGKILPEQALFDLISSSV